MMEVGRTGSAIPARGIESARLTISLFAMKATEPRATTRTTLPGRSIERRHPEDTQIFFPKASAARHQYWPLLFIGPYNEMPSIKPKKRSMTN
jgi:hypothetical protein